MHSGQAFLRASEIRGPSVLFPQTAEEPYHVLFLTAWLTLETSACSCPRPRGTDGLWTMEPGRWTSDIYSPEVVAMRKLRLEEESRTKAMYELRRFLTRIKENIAERVEEVGQVADEDESVRTSGGQRDRRREPSNGSLL